MRRLRRSRTQEIQSELGTLGGGGGDTEAAELRPSREANPIKPCVLATSLSTILAQAEGRSEIIILEALRCSHRSRSELVNITVTQPTGGVSYGLSH